MKISHIGLLILGVSLSFWSVSATDITNVKATPNDTTIEITWNPLENTDMANVEGYALQWSTIQSNVRNDKIPTKTLSGSVTSLSLRAAGFERDEPYYFRVYTYVYEGRGKYTLTNGSQILKWTWQTNGDVETSTVAPNDPVIVDNTTTDEDAELFTFGNLRGGRPFDTSVQMQWSRPSISKNRYDKFHIIVSKNSSLTSPVGTLQANSAQFKGYIEGLEPETTYYAAGEFIENGTAFGRGPVMSFTTSKKFTNAQQAQFERMFTRIKKIGLGAQADFRDGTTTSTVTDDDDEIDTTVSDDDSVATIDKLIKALKLKIANLEKQLDDLESRRSAKLRATRTNSRARTSNVNVRRSTQSTRTSSGSSYRTPTSSNTRFQRKTQPTRRTDYPTNSMHQSAPNNEPQLMY